MKLRAHWNVFSLAEARRDREQRRAAGSPVVELIGWRTVPADKPVARLHRSPEEIPGTDGKREDRHPKRDKG